MIGASCELSKSVILLVVVVVVAAGVIREVDVLVSTEMMTIQRQL